MKIYTVAFLCSRWYLLNVGDETDFQCLDKPLSGRDVTYVTFQTIEITRVLREDLVLPVIIDLESLEKQKSQIGKDLREYKEWKVLPFLRRLGLIDSSFQLTDSTIRSFLNCLVQAYELLNESATEENERFANIEQKINLIIYDRQQKGVNVDIEKVKEKCRDIESQIYRIKNQFQLKYRIFSPERLSQQIVYLESKQFKVRETIRSSFADYRYEDELSGLFYELIRSQDDLDSLLFMLSNWGSAGVVFPEFHGFGTITSRITMRQPALQNLRKENRDIIVPKREHVLLYIDYSQFEAGILASLSDDEDLIRLYNEDIYTDIAEKILGDKDKRDNAKIIFYRFMYGDTFLSKDVKNYFEKFKKLVAFKDDVLVKIKLEGKVGSILGNYRISSEEDNGWALSHVVQATASLIYKNALIKVKQDVPGAQFLIPMHDATLYQLPGLSYEALSAQISDIYINEFKSVCPKLTPRVSTSPSFH